MSDNYGLNLRNRLPMSCPCCGADPVQLTSQNETHLGRFTEQWIHSIAFRCGNKIRVHQGHNNDGLIDDGSCDAAYRVALALRGKVSP